MANALHSGQTPTEGIHVPYNWEYADQAAREAATGFVSADVGKLALQTDECTLWILAATTPTWCAVSGSATTLLDLTDTPSTYSGQSGKAVVVKSSEDGVEFTDIANVDSALYLIIEARKGSSGTINKGEAVFISGYNVGGWIEVEKAVADSSTTMPAAGLANEAITSAANGTVIIAGTISDVDTSSWSFGDGLYVSATTAGQLQNSRPTGASALIQRMGSVIRSDASAGIIGVAGAGRTNALSNLTEGYEWRGDSDAIPEEVVRFGDFVSATADAGPNSTTSSTYVESTSHSTGTLLAGTYLILWSFLYATATSNRETKFRVQLDDTTDLWEAWHQSTVSANNPTSVAGVHIGSLGSGSHTVDLDFAAVDVTTVTVTDIHITLWRIS